MICKERGRHRFKLNLHEQMAGKKFGKDYDICFDCGYNRKTEDSKPQEKLK